MFSSSCTLPSPASAGSCPPLFGRFTGTTAQSDYFRVADDTSVIWRAPQETWKIESRTCLSRLIARLPQGASTARFCNLCRALSSISAARIELLPILPRVGRQSPVLVTPVTDFFEALDKDDRAEVPPFIRLHKKLRGPPRCGTSAERSEPIPHHRPAPVCLRAF